MEGVRGSSGGGPQHDRTEAPPPTERWRGSDRAVLERGSATAGIATAQGLGMAGLGESIEPCRETKQWVWDPPSHAQPNECQSMKPSWGGQNDRFPQARRCASRLPFAEETRIRKRASSFHRIKRNLPMHPPCRHRIRTWRVVPENKCADPFILGNPFKGGGEVKRRQMRGKEGDLRVHESTALPP